MAGITLQQAEAKLAKWLEADERVSEFGESYTIGNRSLTRANAAEIRESIDYWQAKVEQLSRKSRASVRRAQQVIR